MQFRDLAIGDTFDFIDEQNPTHNSFFDTCVKTTARGYKSLSTDKQYVIGRISAKVFHVNKRHWFAWKH
jgi:hypothetical protein